ncbi:hypothetical protein HNQ91_003823 [Filimonas zeae]|uniref:DUF5675 domain-containing protein n=1 Tax=Filimonas zeae TaxID=1737353 RepID=A0A917J1W6_9BACT|nr:DUF5675 family protein [Filimonas zeae]MDR6340758.1 hypothetical protein [Filimonas zeae]GGH74231.1 hypothetical protein GCM10011379_36630 [Filimonas zeae]
MILTLTRTYYAKGTNGVLEVNGKVFCYTIELPWNNNKRQASCIPEETYFLAKRFSVDFKHHLLVQGVKDRTYILIHPANNALRELQGCIAPVTTLTGEGCGDESRAAFRPLLKLVSAAIDKGEKVTLIIQSKK